VLYDVPSAKGLLSILSWFYSLIFPTELLASSAESLYVPVGLFVTALIWVARALELSTQVPFHAPTQQAA
jgi:hypothetical protein